jgi:hypothetical protein
MCFLGIHSRGVVVSIKIDPAPPVVTAETLRAFQRGDYGPIIEP